MSRARWMVLALLALVGQGASAQWFTSSQANDWTTGEQMAKCSAFYLFAAELSTTGGRPAAAESLGNSARGWRLAAMALLASGASRQGFDAEAVSQGVAGARLATLRAEFEQGGPPAVAAMQADHRQRCDPLQPITESIIRALRKSSGG